MARESAVVSKDGGILRLADGTPTDNSRMNAS
jgi:hypothetical protein